MNNPRQIPVKNPKRFISSLFDLAHGTRDGSETLSAAEVRAELHEAGINTDAAWKEFSSFLEPKPKQETLAEVRRNRISSAWTPLNNAIAESHAGLVKKIDHMLTALAPSIGAVFGRKWEQNTAEDLLALNAQVERQLARSRATQTENKTQRIRPSEPRQVLAETRAKELLDRFSLNRPSEIDLDDLAYSLGIEVVYQPLSGADAHLVRIGKVGGITINSAIRERGRQRFALAHEIGHWLLHEDRTQLYLCTADDMRDYQSSVEEIEANIFASELLMPMRMMLPSYRTEDPSLSVPEKIAAAFDVTLTAATLRYVSHFDHPLMVVFSSGGKVKWWRRNESQMEYLYMEAAQPLAKRSRAAVVMAGEGGEAMVEVPWDAWFPHLEERPGTLHEQSRRFDHYDVIMSLLWFDAD